MAAEGPPFTPQAPFHSWATAAPHRACARRSASTCAAALTGTAANVDEDLFTRSIIGWAQPTARPLWRGSQRSEEHTSELQSRGHLVCRLLLEKKTSTGRSAWLTSTKSI